MPLTDRKRSEYRLSLTALRLIATLAKNLGVGKTHIIELAVRKMAEANGVK